MINTNNYVLPKFVGKNLRWHLPEELYTFLVFCFYKSSIIKLDKKFFEKNRCVSGEFLFQWGMKEK